MIVTQVCAAIIIEDLKYWMDLLPCRWLKTAVTVAQNLREDGSLSPEYTILPVRWQENLQKLSHSIFHRDGV